MSCAERTCSNKRRSSRERPAWAGSGPTKWQEWQVPSCPNTLKISKRPVPQATGKCPSPSVPGGRSGGRFSRQMLGSAGTWKFEFQHPAAVVGLAFETVGSLRRNGPEALKSRVTDSRDMSCTHSESALGGRSIGFWGADLHRVQAASALLPNDACCSRSFCYEGMTPSQVTSSCHTGSHSGIDRKEASFCRLHPWKKRDQILQRRTKTGSYWTTGGRAASWPRSRIGSALIKQNRPHPALLPTSLVISLMIGRSHQCCAEEQGRCSWRR
jgi:hypothetical protein